MYTSSSSFRCLRAATQQLLYTCQFPDRCLVTDLPATIFSDERIASYPEAKTVSEYIKAKHASQDSSRVLYCNRMSHDP
jgi:hypothetical protein